MGCLVSSEPRPLDQPDEKLKPIEDMSQDIISDSPMIKTHTWKSLLLRHSKITDDYRFGKRMGNAAYESLYLGIHKRTGIERLIRKIPTSYIQNPEKMLEEVELLRDLVRYM